MITITKQIKNAVKLDIISLTNYYIIFIDLKNDPEDERVTIDDLFLLNEIHPKVLNVERKSILDKIVDTKYSKPELFYSISDTLNKCDIKIAKIKKWHMQKFLKCMLNLADISAAIDDKYEYMCENLYNIVVLYNAFT